KGLPASRLIRQRPFLIRLEQSLNHIVLGNTTLSHSLLRMSDDLQSIDTANDNRKKQTLLLLSASVSRSFRFRHRKSSPAYFNYRRWQCLLLAVLASEVLQIAEFPASSHRHRRS